jgi:nucleoside-diphosphate-sugar epimerase
MRILLTGGSGDLGTLLAADLEALGHSVVNIDMAAPKAAAGTFVKGSILDRAKLKEAMAGVDCVIHIAAWHGIHEANGTKTPQDFHDLNVTGTFNTLEEAALADAKKFIFISSTSVNDKNGVYGHTKILGEEMCRAYSERHNMDVLSLRPRAFIPPWNKTVYNNFIEWAAWFQRGAVHVDDVKAATLAAVKLIESGQRLKNPVYPVDGAYDYTAQDLKDWDKDGGGSTFAKYYPEHIALAKEHGIDTSKKPRVLEIPPEERLPGYAPAYSMRHLLQELAQYGKEGPPAPFAASARPAPKNTPHKPA